MRKPAPDVYQLALERLRITPDHAVAVEDNAHGVKAAHAAGLRCIAIPNPFVAPEEVAGAQLVIRSAAEFPIGEVLHQLG